jgi:hypothetical protein
LVDVVLLIVPVKSPHDADNNTRRKKQQNAKDIITHVWIKSLVSCWPSYIDWSGIMFPIIYAMYDRELFSSDIFLKKFVYLLFWLLN